MIKRTFTLLLTSLMAVSVFAADIAGRITVSFAGNSKYELQVDGKRYSAGSNRLYLNNLRPGRHTIQVYALQRANRRSSKPVYASTFTLRPQYDMHIAIDRYGHVQVNETRSNNGNNRDWNNSYDKNDRDRNDRNDQDWNGRNNRDWNRTDDRWESSRALYDYEYSNLVQQMRTHWTASSKYNTATDAVTRNQLSTQQVSGLLQLLSSESYRLDVAKLAYRNTVDRHNYTQLYNLFSRNAQMDLDRYINSNRY